MTNPPTVRYLAEICGVSPATVSMALRNHPRISAATTKRVQAAAEEAGYQRDPRISELMTHLKQAPSRRQRETLAWITVCDRPETLTSPYIAEVYRGMEAQARLLGYRVDRFNISDTQGIPAKKMEKILLSRGIRGVVFGPLMERKYKIPMEINSFANIAASFVNHGIPISTSMPHHVQNMRLCLHHIQELGYTRPGLYLNPEMDDRVEHRSRGAFLANTGEGSSFEVGEVLRENAKGDQLHDWIRTHRLDVLLTTERDALSWLRKRGVSIPRDLGFLALSANPYAYPEPVSGVNEHPEVIGAFALDLLQGQLHRNDIGPTPFPKEVMYEGSWTGNHTVRRVQPPKSLR
ncbi:MAG: LacI family DNA-binding transcriptional regulator [Kiritimatiellia bacterium]